MRRIYKRRLVIAGFIISETWPPQTPVNLAIQTIQPPWHLKIKPVLLCIFANSWTGETRPNGKGQFQEEQVSRAPESYLVIKSC